MTPTRKTLAALLVMLLLLGASGAALAKEGRDDDKSRDARDARDDRDDQDDRDDDAQEKRGKHKGDFARHGDRWVFRNDQVAVSFHQTGSGKAKPDLRVFLNGTDGEKSGYRVKLLQLYEAENGTLSREGGANRINLAKSQDWNVQTTETNGSLVLTMVHAEAQGIVTLVWRFDAASAAVKFDLKVDNWQWDGDAEGHRLVLDMLVLGHNLRNETGARVSVGDAGYITWATTASATYAANDTRTLNVTAHQKRALDDDGDASDDDEDRDGTHLLLSFDGASGYSNLDYDPTFGVQSVRANPVPGPGVGLIALAAVATVVLVGRRRT